MRALILGTAVLFLAILCRASDASAAAPEAATVRIIGRKNITVTTPHIRLADLAMLSSPRADDDEIIIALQKMIIDPAPAPGRSETISAARVLERLREEGIDLRQIGYVLPRVMTVKRASRTLSIEEVKAAIENALLNLGKEVTLREIDYRERFEITPGEVQIVATPLENPRPGQQVFEVRVKGDSPPEMRFKVRAVVDEWREVPVAARSLAKGTVIGEQDIKMARLNIAAIPPDALIDAQRIVGLESGKPIGDGEVFRSGKLSQPPLITAGAVVTIMYRSEFLQATAAGTALEAGAFGQKIKVKNDSSKKVIVGTVLEPGLVGVN